MGEIRFDDITPIEEMVHIGGTDYVMRETSGDAAVKYDNARIRGYEYQDGRLVKVHDLADLDPLLVSLCLFMTDGKTPVSELTVRSWPARVQRTLCMRAREISGMNEPPQELEKQIEETERQLDLLRRQLAESVGQEQAVKNSPSGTTAG
jgi:hypothetical protein